MEENRKSTLVLLVFPDFKSPSDRSVFEGFLKTALVVTDADIRVLEYQPRYTPLFVHAFLREQAGGWDGPLALICFARGDDLLSAASKVGTFDQFVPAVRVARKVLVTGPNAIDKPHFIGMYPSSSAEGTVNKPLFIMRMGPPYPITLARELGSFLGTRIARRAPTESLMAVAEEPSPRPISGYPATRRRGDETVQGIPLQDPLTGKVRTLAHPEEAQSEDERPTLPPPEGQGPPSGIPPKREDETTKPTSTASK